MNRITAYLIGQLSDIRDGPSIMSESYGPKEKKLEEKQNTTQAKKQSKTKLKHLKFTTTL